MNVNAKTPDSKEAKVMVTASSSSSSSSSAVNSSASALDNSTKFYYVPHVARNGFSCIRNVSTYMYFNPTDAFAELDSNPTSKLKNYQVYAFTFYENICREIIPVYAVCGTHDVKINYDNSIFSNFDEARKYICALRTESNAKIDMWINVIRTDADDY